MPSRSVALAVFAMALWGLNFVFIRIGLDEFPPIFLGCLRFVVAALPAVFFVGRPTVAWKWIVGFGVALGGFKFTLLFLAIKAGMPAGLSSVAIQAQAFFTLILSAVILKDRPRTNQLVALLVSFAGVLVLSHGTRLAGPGPFLLVIAAAASWAVANIFVKCAASKDALNFIVWASVVPIVPLFLLSLLTEGAPAIVASLRHVDTRGVLSLLYIGWISTLVGFGIWGYLMRAHSANVVAPFSLLVPFFGLAFTHVMLGEDLSTEQALGSLLILTGLAVNAIPWRAPQTWRRRKESRDADAVRTSTRGI